MFSLDWQINFGSLQIQLMIKVSKLQIRKYRYSDHFCFVTFAGTLVLFCHVCRHLVVDLMYLKFQIDFLYVKVTSLSSLFFLYLK